MGVAAVATLAAELLPGAPPAGDFLACAAVPNL